MLCGTRFLAFVLLALTDCLKTHSTIFRSFFSAWFSCGLSRCAQINRSDNQNPVFLRNHDLKSPTVFNRSDECIAPFFAFRVPPVLSLRICSALQYFQNFKLIYYSFLHALVN